MALHGTIYYALVFNSGRSLLTFDDIQLFINLLNEKVELLAENTCSSEQYVF